MAIPNQSTPTRHCKSGLSKRLMPAFLSLARVTIIAAFAVAGWRTLVGYRHCDSCTTSCCGENGNPSIGFSGNIRTARRQYSCNCHFRFCDVVVVKSVGRSWMAWICAAAIAKASQCSHGNAGSRRFVGLVASASLLLDWQSDVRLSLSCLVHRHSRCILRLHLAL